MLALVVLGWMTVLLAWSALHIFIVPRIDDYRGALQQQASRAMGLRVEIGSIQAGGGWWVPWFEINDVQLFDRDGRQALLLPRVLAAISPRSVLRAQFEQIDIDSPELEIRKDAQGHVWIAGLDTTQAGDGRAADWVFSQPQWVVRQGVVHWRDESRPQKTQNAAPVLTLQAVEVSLVNHWFGHDRQISANPLVTCRGPVAMVGRGVCRLTVCRFGHPASMGADGQGFVLARGSRRFARVVRYSARRAGGHHG